MIPGMYLGGSEKVLEIIANDQRKSGHNVIIVSFERTPFDSFYQHLDIRHCEVSYEFSLFTKSKIKIKNYEDLITEIAPNVIHSHSYWTDLISHHNLRRDIFYVTHFHLNYENFPMFRPSAILSRKGIREFIDKFLILKKYKRQNCQFIAASRFIYSFYEKRMPSSILKKMVIIPNPVDDRYFTIEKKDVNVQLLTIGRLEDVKNHTFLLDVVHLLKSQGTITNLVVVGDGSLREILRDKARKLSIDKQVIFLGAKKDDALIDLLSRTKLYVHAAKSETFGLAIYEARAAGIPVITLNFEGLDPEIMLDQSIKIIYKGSVETYAAEIVRMLNLSDDSYKAIATNARQRTEVFSERVYVRAMRKFYDQMSDHFL